MTNTPTTEHPTTMTPPRHHDGVTVACPEGESRVNLVVMNSGSLIVSAWRKAPGELDATNGTKCVIAHIASREAAIALRDYLNEALAR